MVSDPHYAASAGEAFKRRVREDGLLASFAAAPAMTAKQVPYTLGAGRRPLGARRGGACR